MAAMSIIVVWGPDLFSEGGLVGRDPTLDANVRVQGGATPNLGGWGREKSWWIIGTALAVYAWSEAALK